MTYIPDKEAFAVYKQLAQLRPSGTSPESIYSPPVNTETVILMLTVVNHANQDRDANIYFDNDGTTYDENTKIAQRTVTRGAESEKTGLFLAMNDSSGNLAVQSNVADSLTFTIWGKEYDLS